MVSRFSLSLLMIGILSPTSAMAQEKPEVKSIRAPFNGYRPQAILDADGVLHVVQGNEEKRGDLFYTRRDPKTGRFSEPIQVNTARAITAGFSMSVGKGGRIHVLIRPNPTYLRMQMPEKKKLIFWDLKYMLYCRMNDKGTAFEEERDLSGNTIGFEGVGPILADHEGNVYAFWHGQLERSPDESVRKIYRIVSTDEGKTFSEPTPVKSEAIGACRCCAMSGLLEKDGTLVLAFRNSRLVMEKKMTKDSYLLVSEDKGESFTATLLEPWEQAGCPGSICTLTSGPAGLFVGWRTRTKVMFAKSEKNVKLISPTAGASTRVPAIAVNKDGVVLFAWAALPRKRRAPATVVWQLFDEQGKAISKKGVVKRGVSQKWGSIAAVAMPDGSFLILYDGPGGGGGDR